MARQIPVFDAYFHWQQLIRIQTEAGRFQSLLRQLQEEVLPEQRQRLRVIRSSGPWDMEWPRLTRLQTERAREVLMRLQQHREMQQEIRELEERLPPRRGLHRLRYANPWIVTWTLFAATMASNAWRLYAAGVF